MVERITLQVSRLGFEGDGVVDGPDGPVYVRGALPGERVTFDGSRIEAIEHSSAQRRIVPLCPHVSRCGGCALPHLSDDLYGRWKANLLTEALATHGIALTPEPMIRVAHNARRRAVLTARRGDRQIELGFHVCRSHEIETIAECAILSAPIVSALPGLRTLAGLLLTEKGEAKVTVIDTPHGLDVDFDGATKKPSADIGSAVVAAAASHRVARLSLKGAPILTRANPALSMAGVDVVPPPGAFLQAVAAAEQAMQKIAAEALGRSKRVADLFCGLGTFSFACAVKSKVLAIDSDRKLIDALTASARKAQGLKPIETRVRDLYQDPLSPLELDSIDGIDAVVFDPPRAGAKAQAEALAKSKVKTVVAISCNPATLGRDLAILIAGGYKLGSVTPIDQFLYTAHIEAVAVLRR